MKLFLKLFVVSLVLVVFSLVYGVVLFELGFNDV